MIYDPLSSVPIGDTDNNAASGQALLAAFATVISQYSNSPVILEMVRRWTLALDSGSDVDAFFSVIWNIDTAEGFGLDILGRIVGVGRVIQIPNAVPYIGWASDAYNWGNGIWSGLGAVTQNFSLSDDAFRGLILAKAALNITDGSIPSINMVLSMLFPNHGNCYVQDNRNMSIAYVFGSALSPVENAIVAQSGVLPKPVGVSVGS